MTLLANASDHHNSPQQDLAAWLESTAAKAVSHKESSYGNNRREREVVTVLKPSCVELATFAAQRIFPIAIVSSAREASVIPAMVSLRWIETISASTEGTSAKLFLLSAA